MGLKKQTRAYNYAEEVKSSGREPVLPCTVQQKFCNLYLSRLNEAGDEKKKSNWLTTD